jgi:hypothetical protein
MFLWILSYQKKNKFQELFSMSFGSFVSFKIKKIWIFVSFQFHTHILQVISYKCKYVLLHLNMLRLFQKINIFFSLRLS